MTRTRTTTGLALVAALAAGTVLAGPAHAGRVKAPLGTNDCYDIVDGSAGYTASTGVVIVNVQLAQPSCRKGTYSLTVYDASGVLGTATATGDGRSSQVVLTATIAPKPDGSVVAVEAETAVTGGPYLDVAPDPQPIDATTDQNGNGIQDNAEVLDGTSPALANFK